VTTTRQHARLAPLVFITGLVAIAVLGIALTRIQSATSPAPAAEAARTGVARFFDRYVERDGRVVRRDQGGDTVSEGQAYALLMAVATGDRRRFDTVWRWTRAHLQRGDGLLAWHWADGHVLDRQPAADADADAARALALAARRFDRSAYRRAADRIAGALLSAETVAVRGRRVLLAGPWARTVPHAVNPSYFAPAGDAVLAKATRQARFAALARSHRAVLASLTAHGRRLPPDWARMDARGVALPSAPASGSAATPEYSYDAVRTLVRLAESCNPADRRLAAGAWPLLRRGRDAGALPRQLSGTPVPGAGTHPAALVGAAAAAAAADRRAQAERLLDRAGSLERERSSYYGGAWVALGRLMLTTRALGGCPPLS
jgi:endo-1,4-beta-D-glucanase Y